jgi:hyperosmotically inducible protein
MVNALVQKLHFIGRSRTGRMTPLQYSSRSASIDLRPGSRLFVSSICNTHSFQAKQRRFMKATDVLKALGVVVCIAVASSAYAQSDAMASSGTMAAPSAKATKQTNRKLGLAVRKALAKAQGFDVSNVYVRARGGAVTLTGTVPDGSQISQAEEVAKSVPGVTSVTNKITLGIQGGGG